MIKAFYILQDNTSGLHMKYRWRSSFEYVTS